MPDTESGKIVLTPLERVRAAAQADKELRFTALLHHVTHDSLKVAYNSLKRGAAAGVDKVTWLEYGADLANNLRDLKGRIHRGGYRAKPSRRVFIPKPDGRQRPLGIASLEDKIVQATVKEVLNAIYEEDFLGFSYGFRSKRNQHQALDALATGISRNKVNWVLDADVSGFFDAINHERLLELMEHRIGDPRILRLIRKWLNAGIMEDGRIKKQARGTPQGANISPLLANIYLHYVFDQWANKWRQRRGHGDVVIVRYADDFVVGFQYRHEAEQFLKELRERFAQYDLELHPDKTRLIEFGRFAGKDRRRRGQGKPETFDFLGFTHICGKTPKGKFLLRRHTIAKRFQATLKAIKVGIRLRMHKPIDSVGRWLQGVVRGYFQYHAIPTNRDTIKALRKQVGHMWLRSIQRRSQRHRLTWTQFVPLLDRWIPKVEYYHPWPDARFAMRHHSR